jgi:lipopolysaccharide/colanic/teichoic acid biosynthesis glycosyltransferase
LRDELNINTNFADFARSKPTIKVDQKINDVVHDKKHLSIILNFLIYSLTFSFFYFYTQNTFKIDNEYLIASGIFLFAIFIGSLLSRKFRLTRQDKSEQIVRTLSFSLFISLIFLVLIFFALKINHITRLAILSATFSGLFLELFYFVVLIPHKENDGSNIKSIKLPLGYILLDGLLLTLFCYFEVAKNIIPFNYNEKEFLLIVLIYLSWVISAATTHKFIPTEVSTSRMNAFELQVKFYLGIILLTTLSMIFLQIEFLNALNFIKALAGYSFVSSLVSILLFARKIKNKSDEATVVFLKAYEMKDTATRSNGRNRNGRYGYFGSETETLREQHHIEFEYLKEYGNVFSILDTILDLKSFDTRKTLVVKSDQPDEITAQQLNSFQLVVNLHVLNDQVKLNDYLLEVKDILLDKGVFVGALLPHHYRYRRYLKKYSFNLANLLYFFDFIWKRVMPKLPVTREIYFTFSKEKDRAISLAEGLGRLVYCGFKVLDLVAVDDVVYFAAVKSGNHISDKKFFYSPIFKMKRVGKDGKPIYVYKLRTMYPYSEFIQDFVYNHNKLETGGKFKDDFRVPVWGSLFRKLWIDELPMLINWLKRDLKFVGVRPISNQYLSLYSKEHQERRKNFKPGLVPPFYADMPKSIEEIELSEKKYLDAYEKNPVKTDFNYFIKAVNNILIKHKRSA